jgi:hypothetical protein
LLSFPYIVLAYSWFPCFLLYLNPMKDKHIIDASIVASLQERDVFNDIARWNKILLSGVASVVKNSKSWISQATRHKELKIKLYLFVIFWLYSIHVLYLINTNQRSMKTWRLVLSISLVSLNLVFSLSCLLRTVCLP